jgi:hypothetical protein
MSQFLKKYKSLTEAYDLTKNEYDDRTQYDTSLKPVTVKSLKKGTFFQRKPMGPVYVRDDYDPSTKKFNIFRADDINAFALVRGEMMVYTGFTY